MHIEKPGAWRTLKRGKQKFVGYDRTEAESDILAFRQEGGQLELVLRENPFYAESGGQVSDTGALSGEGWSLPVDLVRKDAKGTVVGGVFGDSFEPTLVNARVDEPRRRNTERNHSATHLVHAALRRHLGDHVRQQGSLVTPGRLRFDFSHHGPLDADTLRAIERDVNEQIWANHAVSTRQMAYPDALALGAMAFFSEKYGDVVRVVQMGDSIELCGGTHVRTTGQLGLFRLTGQGGVAAGVRRIEAVTGPDAYAALEGLESRLAPCRRGAEGTAGAPGAPGGAARGGAAEARGAAAGRAPLRRRRAGARPPRCCRCKGSSSPWPRPPLKTARSWGRSPTASVRASATPCWSSSARRAAAPST